MAKIDTTALHAPVTSERLAAFVAVAQRLREGYMQRNGFKPEYGVDIIAALNGNKWVRVVAKERTGPGQSCYCFINAENGDIVKGDWKAPVRNGVRGNIHAADLGESCIDWHGPRYLTR